jgi:hypothetical protein
MDRLSTYIASDVVNRGVFNIPNSGQAMPISLSKGFSLNTNSNYSKINGLSRVVLYESNLEDLDQKFYFVKTGDSYWLKNVSTNQCLQPSFYNQESELVVANCINTIAQQWQISETLESYKYIRNNGTDYCISGENIINSGQVNLKRCNSTDTYQNFTFTNTPVRFNLIYRDSSKLTLIGQPTPEIYPLYTKGSKNVCLIGTKIQDFKLQIADENIKLIKELDIYSLMYNKYNSPTILSSTRWTQVLLVLFNGGKIYLYNTKEDYNLDITFINKIQNVIWVNDKNMTLYPGKCNQSTVLNNNYQLRPSIENTL